MLGTWQSVTQPGVVVVVTALVTDRFENGQMLALPEPHVVYRDLHQTQKPPTYSMPLSSFQQHFEKT
jgi:hypothetical protein